MLVCPLPDLIFKQITGGIYYLLPWTGGAGNALGESFQDYIGEVLTASKLQNKYSILAEKEYGKSKKDTVDWIVSDKESALFIECKTKRYTGSSKEELLEDKSTDNDLDDMATAIVQIYKTIRDYRAGLYPMFSFSENLKIYPVVVTMEEWFLMGEGLEKINEKVLKYMQEENLPLEWIDSMVYSICSSNEFEQISQLLNNIKISELIEGKQKDSEMKDWTYYSYLNKKYRNYVDKCEGLFPDIFKEILPQSMANVSEENFK